jgi:multidrug efflux pump subunit AcrA (membrane-fusion protein)
MPAALKAVPTSPPPRSPEREALRVAIQEHVTAKQRLSKISDAQERAGSISLDLSVAVDRAKAALAEAQAGESNYLARVALLEADGAGSPIEAAAAALEKVRSDYAQATKTSAALEKEAVTASQRLDWATINLNDAVKAAVKTDPAVTQLVADYQVAQKTYLDKCRLLSLLLDIGVCPIDGTFGEGYSPQHNFVSRGSAPEAPRWQAAINQLRADADAELPTT